MAKNVTLRGLERLNIGKLPRLRPGASVRRHDPTITLRDPKFIREAILEGVAEGDFEGVVDACTGHLRVANRLKTAKRLRISRQHYHRMMKNPNPRLDTFLRFMAYLKEEAAS